VAFFEDMAGTPGRLLNELVRTAATRLEGRRLAVEVAGGTVELTVAEIEIVGVRSDIEATTDDLFSVAARLGESARRNMMDPFGFGLEAMETLAAAVDRALAAGPLRPLRGEIDLATSASARLVDIDRPSVHTAAVDVACGPVTGRLAGDFEISIVDISVTATIDAGAVTAWLERLGVDVGSGAVVRPADDGLLRVRFERGRSPLRHVTFVVRPDVDAGALRLTADAVEVGGRRVRLPRRLHRVVVVEPTALRPDLELRRFTATAGHVRVDAWLPGLVQPITFEQIDDLTDRMTRRRDDGPLDVPLTAPGPIPGSSGTPTGAPASGTR
jgi:hypothetical protein